MYVCTSSNQDENNATSCGERLCTRCWLNIFHFSKWRIGFAKHCEIVNAKKKLQIRELKSKKSNVRNFSIQSTKCRHLNAKPVVKFHVDRMKLWLKQQ